MKLGEAVDTTALGYREIKERETLRGNAAKVRAERARRLSEYARVDIVAADRVLEAIAAEPGAYGLGETAPKPAKKAAPTPQTPDRARALADNLERLLVGFVALCRLDPDRYEDAATAANQTLMLTLQAAPGANVDPAGEP